MKKIIKTISAVMILSALFFSVNILASAENVVTQGDITYIVKGNSATVYKYSGSGGTVEIPAQISGVNVTEIGNYAFAEEYGVTPNNERITKVIIPSTVKKIGIGAFMECTSLKSVEMLGVGELCDAVFWECNNLKKIAISSDTKKIGENVFGKCTNLTVYCEKNSAIETYAKSNSIPCAMLCPESLKLNKSSVTISGKYKLKATLFPSDAYYKDVYWASSDSKVVTVDQKGNLKAKGYGYATVTCYSVLGEAKAVCQVKVNVPKVENLRETDETATGFTLKWDKSSIADFYRLEVYKNGKWTLVTETEKASYKVKNLSAGTSLKYRVRAYVKIGSSKVSGKWSDEFKAQTLSPKKVENISLKKNTASSYTFKWDAVKGASGYEIFRYNTSLKKYEKVKTTNKTSYTVEKLSSGMIDKYSIRAYMVINKTNVYGPYSSAFTVSVKPADAKKPKVKETTNSTITVTWSGVKNATGYVVYTVKNNKYTKVGTTAKTSFTIKKLNKNTKYSIAVRAYIKTTLKTSYSGYSPVLTAKTNPMPTTKAGIVELFNGAYKKTLKLKNVYVEKTEKVNVSLTETDGSSASK